MIASLFAWTTSKVVQNTYIVGNLQRTWEGKKPMNWLLLESFPNCMVRTSNNDPKVAESTSLYGQMPTQLLCDLFSSHLLQIGLFYCIYVTATNKNLLAFHINFEFDLQLTNAISRIVLSYSRNRWKKARKCIIFIHLLFSNVQENKNGKKAFLLYFSSLFLKGK